MNYWRKLSQWYCSHTGPYHICVCFYGVLHNICLVWYKASVPAAVQLDQSTTAVVTSESTVCEGRKSLNLEKKFDKVVPCK